MSTLSCNVCLRDALATREGEAVCESTSQSPRRGRPSERVSLPSAPSYQNDPKKTTLSQSQQGAELGSRGRHFTRREGRPRGGEVFR